jgi:hypothetical protein
MTKESKTTEIYALQRANGDWFALDDNGRFRVPLFNSSHDAIAARMRHSGMSLFKPVALNARRLSEIVTVGDEGEVDFWLVQDPSVHLNRGRLIAPEEIASLM